MRPEPISSTDQILNPAHILIEFAKRYGAGGYPLQAVLVGIAEELNMDDAESIQFGNTAFINHYVQGEPTVYMRALNVDTAKNFVDNIENYVSYVYGRGIKTIITNYSDESITGAIKAAHKRISENNKNLKSTLEFGKESKETIATIKLKDGDKK